MYCPKCGKENLEGARFCMHCGADLSGYNVEFSPNINVSPKVSAYAKAEGVPYPKWKPKVEEYVKIKGESLPVYSRFAEFDGKPFCPHCEAYDSLGEEPILKTWHIEGRSVTIVEYNVYRCLACGKKALTFRNREKYLIPSISGYFWIYDTGKVPVFHAKPEICPECKIPNTVKYIKKVALPKKSKLCEPKAFLTWGILDQWTEVYGDEYIYYRCHNCESAFLVQESSEECLASTSPGEGMSYSGFRGRYGEDKIVEFLCQSCFKEPALRKDFSSFKYKCEVCGKILCENCVKSTGGILEHHYCPSCASSRMCKICGKNVAEYTCSSCGKRICKDCAQGMLSKKCPICGSKLREL